MGVILKFHIAFIALHYLLIARYLSHLRIPISILSLLYSKWINMCGHHSGSKLPAFIHNDTACPETRHPHNVHLFFPLLTRASGRIKTHGSQCSTEITALNKTQKPREGWKANWNQIIQKTGANRRDANGIWYVHAGEKKGTLKQLKPTMLVQK